MKVLHINTSDVGGAAKACERLHFGLSSNSVDSNLLSLFNYRGNSVFYNFFLEDNLSIIDRSLRSLKYRFYQFEKELILLNKPRNYEIVSFPKSAFDITTHKLYQEADLIHLHWTSGFLDYSSFFKKNKKPIIWTLHDLNPFCGLFHYENDLKKNFKYYQDLDRKVWLRKIGFLKNAENVTFVAISDWIRNKFFSSDIGNMFPCIKIPNGINLNLFKPQDKNLLRRKFLLPLDKKIILFVSENVKNERKGFKYLIETLSNINNSNSLLCVLGKSENIEEFNGLNVHNFGFVEDDNILSQIYALADLFVVTSLEDNYPNTILEATSSGILVVGFRAGGISEMVVQDQTGLLSDIKDVRELAKNINTLLVDEKSLMRYSMNSRKFAEANFNHDEMVKQYRKLYYQVC